MEQKLTDLDWIRLSISRDLLLNACGVDCSSSAMFSKKTLPSGGIADERRAEILLFGGVVDDVDDGDEVVDERPAGLGGNAGFSTSETLRKGNHRRRR